MATNAFYSVLEYDHGNLYPLDGSGLTNDADKGELPAISRPCTGIAIWGCWFHFCRALQRVLESLVELFELVQTNDDAMAVLLQFQSNALLPAEVTKDVFRKLSMKGSENIYTLRVVHLPFW